MFENLGTPENERRSVKILDTADFDVKMPDEVPVLGSVTEGEIGRAILREKDGGVYADIVLNKGTMEGMVASAIGQKFPHGFTITGVGLVEEEKSEK